MGFTAVRCVPFFESEFIIIKMFTADRFLIIFLRNSHNELNIT